MAPLHRESLDCNSRNRCRAHTLTVAAGPLRLWLPMASGRRVELELRDARELAAVLTELDRAG